MKRTIFRQAPGATAQVPAFIEAAVERTALQATRADLARNGSVSFQKLAGQQRAPATRGTEWPRPYN